MEGTDLILTPDNPQSSAPNRKASANDLQLRPQPSAALQHYLHHAVPENTRRAYESDLRHFMAWGGAIPASEVMVAEYLAAHAETLSVATLERRLATISKAHTALGEDNPARSQLVKTTLRGIRRLHGAPPRQAAPLLPDNIAAMIGAMENRLKDKRDRALILVGFFGAFRRSELIAINCTDIEVFADRMLVTLRRSKTDQERRGRVVAIAAGETDLCPVHALRDWLSAAQILHGPVFRAVSRNGSIAERALSPESVNLVVKTRVEEIGLDPVQYSGHSLRAGFATAAAHAGIPTWRIRAQTGHKTETMLERYIRHESKPLVTFGASGS